MSLNIDYVHILLLLMYFFLFQDIPYTQVETDKPIKVLFKLKIIE